MNPCARKAAAANDVNPENALIWPTRLTMEGTMKQPMTKPPVIGGSQQAYGSSRKSLQLSTNGNQYALEAIAQLKERCREKKMSGR